jgi:hypothetical protein|tara:strand:- start:166 stop:420 length:255 start_codon:yes stop_codon:yes gene_type:complete
VTNCHRKYAKSIKNQLNIIGYYFIPAIKEINMMKWIKDRTKERTSWDGAVCIALGLMILFMAPLAKIAAGLAIAWGVWTIWKSE